MKTESSNHVPVVLSPSKISAVLVALHAGAVAKKIMPPWQGNPPARSLYDTIVFQPLAEMKIKAEAYVLSATFNAATHLGPPPEYIILNSHGIRLTVQLPILLRFIQTRTKGPIIRSSNNLVKLVLWALNVMLHFMEIRDKAS